MVRPELTCLPKKFHQFIVPSIRRVYIDTARHDGLRKKLAAAETRAAALEADKERLMGVCERHMAAARAHSAGETGALRRVEGLEHALEDSREEVQDAQRAVLAMKVKYDKMKRHCRAVEASRKDASGDAETSHTAKRNSSVVDLSLDETPVSPKRLRIIRPLPRSRPSGSAPKNAPAQQDSPHLRLRPRSSAPEYFTPPCELGSPFRSRG